MRIKKTEKLFATMMTTAILMVPTLQAFENDSSSNEHTM